MKRPACFDRAPLPATVTYNAGLSADGRQLTAEFPFVMSRGCRTWEGTGIDGPHGTNTRYPIAHGWDCSGCRLLPAGVLA